MATTTRTKAVELTDEQAWVLHDVLLERIDAERRDPEGVDPPALGVYQAFDALDSGQRHLTNCHSLREELERAVTSGDLPPEDIRTAEQLIDRLTDRGF